MAGSHASKERLFVPHHDIHPPAIVDNEPPDFRNPSDLAGEPEDGE
jgi:hypothetical protein